MKKFIAYVVLFVSGIILMGAGTIGDAIYLAAYQYPDSISVGGMVIIIGMVMAIVGGILMFVNAVKKPN